MPRWKLVLEYDGTDYCGWQVQPHDRTVQGELEAALARLTGAQVGVVGAGRTDAGVHALHQVAHCTLPAKFDRDPLLRALNGILPRDVRVRDCTRVHDEFHARYDARQRWYHYRIARSRRALERRYRWETDHALDGSRMQAAAAGLVGPRDCRLFAAQPDTVDNAVCRIDVAEWREDPDEWRFVIAANRFLMRMVRQIVGTLVDVGRGRRSVQEFEDLVAAGDRSRVGSAAPARGLCLMDVRYDTVIPAAASGRVHHAQGRPAEQTGRDA